MDARLLPPHAADCCLWSQQGSPIDWEGEDPTPSEADIKVTRDLIRAGQLLKIEIADHIIIGSDRHTSLRANGYFY